MKKILISIMLGILLLSLVSAGLGLDKEGKNLTDNQKQKFVDKINEKYGTNFTKEEVGTGEIRLEVKEMLKSQERTKNKTLWLNVSGKNITIKEIDEDKLELITTKINAKTGLNLTLEEVSNLSGDSVGAVLRVFLSNGRWAEVKHMPNQASEKALSVLNYCGLKPAGFTNN